MTLIQIVNMNERIKELEKQCWSHRVDGVLVDGHLHFDTQKFAELIVRECVGVADDYVKDCICEEHVNCKHPQSAIGRKIKQHFGVGE